MRIWKSLANRLNELIKDATRQRIMRRFKHFRGMMPADYKFDRDEANSR